MKSSELFKHFIIQEYLEVWQSGNVHFIPAPIRQQLARNEDLVYMFLRT